jgi:23S rRNA (cytosine1962-C5)-methyltransferase
MSARGERAAAGARPSGSDPARAGAAIVLRRGAERRIAAGHPWVYRGVVADARGRPEAGGIVDVLDAAGRFLGRGHYNPRPSLAVRLLTRRDEPIDEAFFLRRLAAAAAYRRSAGLEGDAFRLVWSEADGLPGLVVDRYAGISVVQCLTLGMARALPALAGALDGLYPGGLVYRADDPTAAGIEGFQPVRGWLRQPGDPELPAEHPVTIAEGPCRFTVVLGAGHKTGWYLDQRENRELVARHAAGRRMLDAFCYAGGFACLALAAGARAAVLVDSSPEALAGARANLEANGLSARAELRQANAFDELRRLTEARERFGLVVLDPPPFTRRKEALDAAARGYKEIALRALRLLEPGGLLATFSCSHHVTPALFEAICRDAAGDAGVEVRVLAVLGQSRDHPVLLGVPETRYLTGLLLQAV